MEWNEDKPKFWLKHFNLILQKNARFQNVQVAEKVNNAVSNFYDAVWFDHAEGLVLSDIGRITRRTKTTETFNTLYKYLRKCKLPYKNNVFTFQHGLEGGEHGPRMYSVLFSESPEHDGSVEVILFEIEDVATPTGSIQRRIDFTPYLVCVEDNKLDITLYLNGIKTEEGVVLSYDKTENTLCYVSEEKISETREDELIQSSYKLMFWAYLLNYVSTTKDNTFDTLQPRLDPKKKFLNSKRIKKGEAPFCEWIVGKFDNKKSYKKISDVVGTHASPREHHRRGHWRTYKSGKQGWVRAAKVGDPSLGVIRKTLIVGQSKEV